MNNLEFNVIQYLRTPIAIRARCDRLFNLACQDKLRYFRVNLTQLDKAANYVIDVIREQYPDFNIPFHSRWRHFEIGGISRISELDESLKTLTPIDKIKIKFDLAIISVLLDAGAGTNWQYYEQETGQIYHRSEGLAIASFRMFCQGIFSSNPDFPFQADAAALSQLKLQTLAAGFQVTQDNPLIGLEGRLELLQNLGKIISHNHLFFDSENPRPGNLGKYLYDIYSETRTIKAAEILSCILQGIGEIWPGRYKISGVNLGDVWQHSALQGENIGDGYVPFHKLSQWLTYSLLEPLQEIGLEVIELEALTGLPEYRNGGFCLDIGLLEAKDRNIFLERHLPGSEVIVEWRALTVNLLDIIAISIREKLNLTAVELPLVKILQGGTWTAGRKIAAELRVGGIPPIQIESDGTVF
ncbi:uracil phosphoribosyltransferase [Oscillatoriales cyanobacterium USR001]|nr:uracil phosphoribosyltransferase [Oscillatoriales cyanobacterium USR001]